MELRKKILSAVLILLMLTTNLVVSIDSVYCYCFKTTTYEITGLAEHECTDHADSACTDDSCCRSTVEKLPCKETTQILVSNQGDFTGNSQNVQFKKILDTFVVPPAVVLASVNCPECFAKSIFADFSPPFVQHSQAFLQVFLC